MNEWTNTCKPHIATVTGSHVAIDFPTDVLHAKDQMKNKIYNERVKVLLIPELGKKAS